MDIRLGLNRDQAVAGAGTSGTTNITGLTRPRNRAMMYVIKF